MMDAFRNPQKILVVGGTSEIGLAILDEILNFDNEVSIILMGRSFSDLQTVADQITERNLGQVQILVSDFSSIDSTFLAVEQLSSLGQIDLCILAAGYLPELESSVNDFETAAQTTMINFVGPVTVLTDVISKMTKVGKGCVIVLSSVAGMIPRQSNFVYGSGKAGLDFWAEGTSKRLKGTGVSLFIVRPGMIRTRMSHGLKEAPFTRNPDDVAHAVAKMYKGKSKIIWVPSGLRVIFVILLRMPRALARAILNK
jgi:decaprenylphospho-beta-D-erythro-pentofuranosid-2-ulose 2-reductase